MTEQELNEIREYIGLQATLEDMTGYPMTNGHYSRPLERDISMYNEIIRLQVVSEEFKTWIVNYKKNRVGENYNGRYCVSISVDEILSELEKIELKYANFKKNRED